MPASAGVRPPGIERNGDIASSCIRDEDTRRRTRDIDDFRLLAEIIGLNSAEEALKICAEFHLDESVSARSSPVRQGFDGARGRAADRHE